MVMDNSPAGERNEEFEAARRRFGPGRLDASGRKARALHPRGPSIPQWASLTCFSHQSCQVAAASRRECFRVLLAAKCRVPYGSP